MLEDKLRCYICNDKDDKGIILVDEFICNSCEIKIINSNPNDKKYKSYMTGIKEIILKKGTTFEM